MIQTAALASVPLAPMRDVLARAYAAVLRLVMRTAVLESIFRQVHQAFAPRVTTMAVTVPVSVGTSLVVARNMVAMVSEAYVRVGITWAVLVAQIVVISTPNHVIKTVALVLMFRLWDWEFAQGNLTAVRAHLRARRPK